MVVEVVISSGRPTGTAATIAHEAVRLFGDRLNLAPQDMPVTRPLAFGGGTTCRPLVNPRGNAVVYPLNQPRSCLFSRREHDIVLEDVIQIDEPAPAAIENGDRPTKVGSRLKVGVVRVRTLEDLHCSAS